MKLLGFPAPAGFERFFADFAELIAQMPPDPPDMSKIGSLYGRYGLEVVGPPPVSAH